MLNITFIGTLDAHGVFNVNSREVVSCTLMPWQDERGVAQTCLRRCLVDEDVVSVAYVQGLYVLDYKGKTSTPVVPPIDDGNAGLPVIGIGVGFGLGVAALGVGACIVLSHK